MTTISAAEANRHFSQVLRQVARGETLIITSRGKPMATIAPITRQAGRSLAQRQLLERLASQPPAGDRSWTRAESGLSLFVIPASAGIQSLIDNNGYPLSRI